MAWRRGRPAAARHREVHVKQRDLGSRLLGRPLRSASFHSRGRMPRWVWLAAGAWLLYAGLLSEHSFWRIAELRHEVRSANAELQQVRAQTAQLDAQLNDPEERRFHAEEIARTQHGWAAPGEVIYRFRAGGADTTRR